MNIFIIFNIFSRHGLDVYSRYQNTSTWIATTTPTTSATTNAAVDNNTITSSSSSSIVEDDVLKLTSILIPPDQTKVCR